MQDYKVFLGYLATFIAFVAYVPYFRDIFRGRTKPHTFSWLVWAVLTGIAFAAQVYEGAGSGSWVTGFSTVVCVIVFLVALIKGKKDFPLFDWFALFGAAFSLVLWWWIKDPTLSVILISIIDAFGFLPTFRKSYNKPYEETAPTYALNCIKWVVSLFALNTFALSTWFYPASLVLMNGLFLTMLLIRRKKLS